ncbi:MAG: hypothetical protein DRO36_05045 [Candidatus Hecatellales archaeon]|nr:MAG: hypothetical protein DRO36_05045 [Candidatus Hecatellales archaeon]
MLHEFKDGWIETKDALTVRALIQLKEGRVVAALSSCIISWSESEPINEYTVGRLKAHIGDRILRRLLNDYNELLKNKSVIERLAHIAINGLRLANDENAEYFETLQYLTPCLSPWGGFLQLPEAGGVLDQRGDLMVFLLALRDAYASKKGG